MLVCEIHGTTYPEGYECPTCQRTDSNIVKILFALKSIEKRLEGIEQYIQSRPDLPQHLWSQTRRMAEAERQRRAANVALGG